MTDLSLVFMVSVIAGFVIESVVMIVMIRNHDELRTELANDRSQVNKLYDLLAKRLKRIENKMKEKKDV